VFLLHCDVDGLTESTTVEQIAGRYLDKVLRPICPSSWAAIAMGGWRHGISRTCSVQTRDGAGASSH
jgi:hypothetical protein